MVNPVKQIFQFHVHQKSQKQMNLVIREIVCKYWVILSNKIQTSKDWKRKYSRECS